MAAAVDVCIGELAKLKHKVQARNFFLFKVQETEEVADEEAEAAKITKKQSSSSSSSLKSSSKAKDESTLSEATVFMLMDRFAPW